MGREGGFQPAPLGFSGGLWGCCSCGKEYSSKRVDRVCGKLHPKGLRRIVQRRRLCCPQPLQLAQEWGAGALPAYSSETGDYLQTNAANSIRGHQTISKGSQLFLSVIIHGPLSPPPPGNHGCVWNFLLEMFCRKGLHLKSRMKKKNGKDLCIPINHTCFLLNILFISC